MFSTWIHGVLFFQFGNQIFSHLIDSFIVKLVLHIVKLKARESKWKNRWWFQRSCCGMFILIHNFIFFNFQFLIWKRRKSCWVSVVERRHWLEPISSKKDIDFGVNRLYSISRVSLGYSLSSSLLKMIDLILRIFWVDFVFLGYLRLCMSLWKCL